MSLIKKYFPTAEAAAYFVEGVEFANDSSLVFVDLYREGSSWVVEFEEQEQ